MSWWLLVLVVAVLGLACLAVWRQRTDLARMRSVLEEREQDRQSGADSAQLQHPVVDLSRCLGCGTCVAACPEDGVLELVHGQAVVAKGARCQGISACERECPVGAITVTIANLDERDDVPAVGADLEAIGEPGLFLAGEVTAHALIKTAIEHGTRVAATIAQRRMSPALPSAAVLQPHGLASVGELPSSDVLDLCVVGAGPAGLACSLEATRNGLSFVTLEQQATVGGTVAQYPRAKLVLSEPVDLPLHGRLSRNAYTKEDLIALWDGIVQEHQLPILGGQTFEGLERDADGLFLVRTQDRFVRARNVCMALGRRGTPRHLGVPGEDLPKVANHMLDASSVTGRRVLVVGGGDAAIEAALGLAEQPGNEVTLSYRKQAFFRIRSRNDQRLRDAAQDGRIRLLLQSEVTAIHPDAVELAVVDGAGIQKLSLSNDDVFIMIGGTPPVATLQAAGVSFDPGLRPPARAIEERGTGLLPALVVAFAMSLAALVWCLLHLDYYGMPVSMRPTHPDHHALRPGRGLGLGFGIGSAALIVVNLLYLARRSPKWKLRLGSLRGWMTVHVATGILAFLGACLHSAMAPRSASGGYAMWGLAVLLLTGAIGRYVYAWIPRAANGRELRLDEVKATLAEHVDDQDADDSFEARAQRAVLAVVARRQWRRGFFGRVASWLGGQRDLRRLMFELRAEGVSAGRSRTEVGRTQRLARRAHHEATAIAHFEDLRAVLSTWRYLHRWIAVLMVVFLVQHIVSALFYGSSFGGGAR
tara:strand:+ start:7648 stop:9927 length:2280 start_codon:yes stop_codon:yes gene_type:complete